MKLVPPLIPALFFFAAGAVFFTACGGNHAPVLQPISDQTAAVGVELSIELRATDADGDTLHFDFAAPGISDIKSRAQLSAFADNVAIFRWTPQAGDSNSMPYAFDFSVTDGKSTTTETVQISVSDSGASAPVFRQPLGTGTTLDLAMEMCIDVNIVVEDTDSTMVTIAEEDPKIDGAMLTQTDDFDATWHWCPSPAQIAQQDHYLLHLSADDGTSKTLKDYLIVLRTAQQMNCPGAPPAIMHTPPGPQSTVTDIQISAEISDDVGVKSAILYWSTSMPADPPDVTTMTPLSMSRTSGDALNGTWQAAVPNPVAGAAAGSKQTIYYLIEAKDNDDPTGMCDHVVDSPATGTYAVDVTNPGGSRGTGVNCDPCSNDVQCADGYECLQIGSAGTFCAKECAGAGTCDADYSCSSTVLTSLGGKMAHFCRATSMTCPPMMVCNEDALEDNDSRTNIPDATSANIMSNPMSPPCTAAGNTVQCSNLVVCPRNGGATDDEDWYAVLLPTSAIVTAGITIKDYSVGSHADLDMELTDAGGNVLDFSVGTGTTEYVAACQPASAQKVFANVFTFDNPVVASKYDLTVTRTGPDSAEPDNDHNTNSQLGTTGASVTQNICGDEDWFWTILNDREQLVVDLKYTARSTNEDLDIKLMRDDCTPAATPAPAAATNSPVDGGTRLTYNTPDGGSDCYYVVVAPPSPESGNVYQLNSVKAP